MRKANELRDMSEDELLVLHTDTRKELFHLKNMIKETKKMEKPHLLRLKRKEIARMLTVITEKQSGTNES